MRKYALLVGWSPVVWALTWQVWTVDISGNVGMFSSLALDTLNFPHIAYYDFTNQDLRYAYWNGASWVYDTVDTSGDVGRWASIALDANGNPHISYYDNTNGLLKYATLQGGVWNIDTVDGGIFDVGQWTSIAIDAQGYPHISYYDVDNAQLKYAQKILVVWTLDIVDNTTPDVGDWTSLKLDSQDIAHISYRNADNHELRYATGSISSGWTITQIESNRMGSYTSIALNSQEYPAISYRKYGGGGSEGLKFAWFDGASWNTTVLDAPFQNSNNGRWTSIEFNSNDLPWISYYDRDNRDLKVMHFNGASWDTFWVDTTGFVGLFTSLELSSFGTPNISYYDETNGDLKYAFAMDNTPPGAPQNLLANGSSPSPWNNTGIFELTWTNPPDESGIKRSLYKLGTPPTFNLDTTGSLNPVAPDTAQATQEGGQWLFLWLEDNVGNIDYTQRDSVFLRYETIPPTGSEVILSNRYTNSLNFIVSWTNGSDTGGSGLSGRYDIWAKDGSGPWFIWLDDTLANFASFTGTDGSVYYFEALAIDNAGNTEARTGIPEDTIIVDTTAPPAPQNLLANGSSPSPWTNNTLFEITWTNPPDTSGINRVLYKLQNPPGGSFDTTGSFHFSPDTVILNMEGIIPLYVWFEDSAGNINIANAGTVNLRRDTTSPFGCIAQSPSSSGSLTFSVEWSRGNDALSGLTGTYNVWSRMEGDTWTLWLNDYPDTFAQFSAPQGGVWYYFEAINKDSAGNLENRTGIPEDSTYVDVSAPGPPQNLLANGGSPSPWTNDTIFEITWTNPPDPNGILRALYKLGSPPTSNFDTTGTLRPNPPDTVFTSYEGGIMLYLWLQDSLQNVDFNYQDSVGLRHDRTPPTGSVVQSSLYSTTDTFTITWSSGSDSGGAGLTARYDIWVKDSANPWALWLSDTLALRAVYTGMDGNIYYFEALSKDSAGNVELRSGVPEDSTIVDLTSPYIVSTNPADGDTGVPLNTNISINFSEALNETTVVDTNFSITGSVSGIHSFSLNYDSNLFLVDLNPVSDFAPKETVTISASFRIKDIAGNSLSGPLSFSFWTKAIPDTQGPISLTSLVPSSPEPFNYLEIYVEAADTGYGNAIVSYVEIFIDSTGADGAGIPLNPVDGSFDENIETATTTIDLAPLSWNAGETHFIFAHSRDTLGNYGDYDTLGFVVSPDDDSLPPSFLNFVQDTLSPDSSIYIEGNIQDPSGVYDDTTGSSGQGVYLLWDTDGEVDTSAYEIQMDLISGNLYRSEQPVPGQPMGTTVVYRVYAYDNDFDTQHPLDRSRGNSQDYRIYFTSPMTVALTHSPQTIYIGDDLIATISANLPFSSAPVCSLRTLKGTINTEISLSRVNATTYEGSISTTGGDIGKARIWAYYESPSGRKIVQDSVVLQARGEFLPEKDVYVWPNPVDDEGNFHFYVNQNARVTVEVYDIRGKRIMVKEGTGKGGLEPHTPGSNAIKLNLRSLSPDIYIFRVIAKSLDTDEEKSVMKKFAIVR